MRIMAILLSAFLVVAALPLRTSPAGACSCDALNSTDDVERYVAGFEKEHWVFLVGTVSRGTQPGAAGVTMDVERVFLGEAPRQVQLKQSEAASQCDGFVKASPHRQIVAARRLDTVRYESSVCPVLFAREDVMDNAVEMAVTALEATRLGREPLPLPGDPLPNVENGDEGVDRWQIALGSALAGAALVIGLAYGWYRLRSRSRPS